MTPNPVLETAEIKCDEIITNITVYNTEMKPVYSIQPMEHASTLNMNKLPAGVYIISVITVTDQFVQRIVRL